MQAVVSLFMLKTAFLLLSLCLAGSESEPSEKLVGSRPKPARSEELERSQKILATNIKEATPELFYDGNFEKECASPYPLNKGDFLVLARCVASGDGRLALTFHKHNATCGPWKRFKHSHLSLTKKTKEELKFFGGFLLSCGLITAVPAVGLGVVVGCCTAGIVFVSGGTSYAVAYALGVLVLCFVAVLCVLMRLVSRVCS
jgi:hypothetical protein